MNKGLISVVLPCYNVEKFLPDCLKSLENQTIKNYELIFVNDGSKDNTQQILEDFCAKAPNRILINQENSGPSHARNTGIERASGEYLVFVDSDDIIAPSMFENLLNSLTKANADVACCGISWIKEKNGYKGKVSQIKKEYPFKAIGGKDEILAQYFSGRFHLGPCNKIFKVEKLMEMKCWPKVFAEKTKYAEDMEFCIKYLSACENLAFIKKDLYFYRQRSGSIVHQKFSEDKLHAYNAFKFADELDKNEFKKTQTYLNARRCIVSLEMVMRMKLSKYQNSEIIRVAYENFKNNIKYVFKGRKNPLYLRIFVPMSKPFVWLLMRKHLRKQARGGGSPS